jgi:hypothetical protein
MSKADAANENIQIGQRIQERFEFFMIGLAFAVVALAVQTAEFSGPVLSRIAELIGWLAFLISGLAGLWRIEWTPSLYKLYFEKMAAQHRIEQLREVTLRQGNKKIYEVSTDSMVEPSTLVKNQNEWIDKIDAKIEPLENTIGKRYTVMRTALLIGFVALILSRSLAPVIEIIDSEPSESKPAAAADSLSRST